MRFTLVAAVALTLCPTAYGWHRSPRIDETIRFFAGHGYARCLTPKESVALDAGAVTTTFVHNGQWTRPGGYISIAAGWCENIMGVLNDPKAYLRTRADWQSAAEAFLLLTHEIGHMTGWPGWKNEARMGCYGIRHVHSVIRHLGVPKRRAKALLWYAHQQYALWPHQYHLRGCV